MIVDRLESYYRELAAKRQKEPRRWARASSLGYCPRRLAYTKLGQEGEPLQPRRLAIFEHGNSVDWAVKTDILNALGDQVITRDCKGSTTIEGVTITGECDGLYQYDDRVAVLEIKSMADYSFERALRGEIDEIYQCQAWVYTFIFSCSAVTFVCYRKETSHYCEVTFDSRLPETIVTQRLGGDELEIARQDPLLLAEVKSPFSPAIEAKVRKTLRDVNACNSLDELPEGVNAIEPEIIKVQGKDKAKTLFELYGEPDKIAAGGWHTFDTGRKIIGFPCTYCAYKQSCFPGAQLEINGGKPKWITEGR